MATDWSTLLIQRHKPVKDPLDVWIPPVPAVLPKDTKVRHSAKLDAFMCAEFGLHEYLVQCIEKDGERVNTRDNVGRTPLFWAAEVGNVAACQFLLKHGARVNATDVRMRTPLHIAALADQPDTLKYVVSACTTELTHVFGFSRILLAHGGNVHWRDQRGKRALDFSQDECRAILRREMLYDPERRRLAVERTLREMETVVEQEGSMAHMMMHYSTSQWSRLRQWEEAQIARHNKLLVALRDDQTAAEDES